MTEPRLMSGSEAAAYLGLTPTTFSKWVAAGTMPKPLPGTRRWDRKAIDLLLDKLSGIVTPAAAADDNEVAEKAWEAKYAARRRRGR